MREYILYMKKQKISRETHEKLLALQDQIPQKSEGRGLAAAAGLASTRIKTVFGAVMSARLR